MKVYELMARLGEYTSGADVVLTTEEGDPVSIDDLADEGDFIYLILPAFIYRDNPTAKKKK